MSVCLDEMAGAQESTQWLTHMSHYLSHRGCGWEGADSAREEETEAGERGAGAGGEEGCLHHQSLNGNGHLLCACVLHMCV